MLDLLLCLMLLGSEAPGTVQLKSVEPRKIKKPGQIGGGSGVVLLSVRTQRPAPTDFYIWFSPADDLARTAGKVLRFKHRGGLNSLARSLESDAGIYAVPPGLWRIAAHAMGCEDRPIPGTVCRISGGGDSYVMPTGIYDDSWISIEVQPGKLVDAGEFILELPPGSADVELPKRIKVDEIRKRADELAALALSFRVKWRPIPKQEASKPISPFLTLPRGGRVVVDEKARSNVLCERSPKELGLGALPFRC